MNKKNTFKVNKYITLKFEEGITKIYVNDQFFNQCRSLVLNIPIRESSHFDNLDSIDEIAEVLKSSEVYEISPASEFWGHCSNLQTWVEYNYDTRLLHSNLSFPLLKRLTEVGDSLAKRKFKEEIAKRLESGYPPVIRYLDEEGYLNYLSAEELKLTILNPNIKLFKEIVKRFSGIHYDYDNPIGDLDNLLTEEDIFRAALIPEELEILKKLEEWAGFKFKLVINLNDFAYVDSVMLEFNCFIAEKGHITSLKLRTIEPKFSLPQSIIKLTKLEYLELSYLSKHKTSPELFIPVSIFKLKTLKSLHLSLPNLAKIPDSIKNLTNLENLSIIDDDGKMILPESIKDLENLKYLFLCGHLITIPESIGNLINLEDIRFYAGLIKIPHSIGKLRILKNLVLHCNSFSIPNSVKNLKSLTSLEIKGKNIDFIENITRLMNLRRVRLSKDLISDKIKLWLKSLNLKYLWGEDPIYFTIISKTCHWCKYYKSSYSRLGMCKKHNRETSSDETCLDYNTIYRFLE